MTPASFNRRGFISASRLNGLNPYAHTRSKDGVLADENTWETITEHMEQVSSRTERFADVLGLGFAGRILGLLHDLGKFDPTFYQRIRGLLMGSFDHAAKGGSLADITAMGFFTQIILGHHRYIPDNFEIDKKTGGESGTDYRIRMAKSHKCDPTAIPSDADIKKAFLIVRSFIQAAIDTSYGDPTVRKRFEPLFFFGLQKFLYSCLVDADYLGTENFYQETEREKRHDSLNVILEKFLGYHERFIQKKKTGKITWLNAMRNDIWDSAVACGGMAGTAFTMTGPTGSGKTLAYIVMALMKAIRDKKNRVIIVLPYCSIISQVCDILRKAVGEKNVLEHHSGYDLNEQIMASSRYKQYKGRKPGWKKLKGLREDIEDLTRKSFENWDAPIVVTTREQFDESFFCRYPGRSRRIHNMANSVIVFDEVQTTPKCLTIPFVGELHVLRYLYNSTLILSTATQPAYGRKPERLWGLDGVIEVVAKAKEYFKQASKRVRFKQLGTLSVGALADKLGKHHQVLCVVNTRENSKLVSEALTERKIPHLHMNTLVHKRRVRAIIKEVRRRLDNNERIVLITTQIVEAGVDLDFPIGYTERCPLDSKLQRAGRVNRNAKAGVVGDMFEFSLSDGAYNRGYMTANSITEAALYQCNDYDVRNLDTVDFYYEGLLFDKGNDLDSKGIVVAHPNPGKGVGAAEIVSSSMDGKSPVLRLKYSLFDTFKYVADRVSIAIPINKKSEETLDVVQDLIARGFRPGRKLVSRLQDYMVSIYENEFEDLLAEGVLEESYGFYILRDMSWYDKKLGLMVWNLTCHTK